MRPEQRKRLEAVAAGAVYGVDDLASDVEAALATIKSLEAAYESVQRRNTSTDFTIKLAERQPRELVEALTKGLDEALQCVHYREASYDQVRRLHELLDRGRNS